MIIDILIFARNAIPKVPVQNQTTEHQICLGFLTVYELDRKL